MKLYSNPYERKASAMVEDTPIFTFPKLKERLTAMGIRVGEAGAWKTVGTVDVLPADIGKRLLFEDGNIYYIDDEGIKRRGFMYKTDFNFEFNGKPCQPKFHVCNCKTVCSFGRQSFRFANAEPIKVFSKNSRREVLVEHMDLCGNCRSMLNYSESMRIEDSTDFVELLKETGDVKEPHEEEVDIFGYVKGWEDISTAYRLKHDFTCARCGIKVKDGLDHQYMHVHHKNGKKTDNRAANLECLCIRCHARVDETHRKNFSKGAKRIMLEEFMKKYC